MSKLQYLSQVTRASFWLKQRLFMFSIPEGHLSRDIPRVPSRKSTHSTPSPQCVNVQSLCSISVWFLSSFCFQMFTWAKLPIWVEYIWNFVASDNSCIFVGLIWWNRKPYYKHPGMIIPPNFNEEFAHGCFEMIYRIKVNIGILVL